MYMDQLATLYIKWVISHSNLAESLPLKQNHSWEGLSHIYDGKKMFETTNQLLNIGTDLKMGDSPPAY